MRVWNWPVLPGMPWVMTLVSLLMRMLMSVSLFSGLFARYSGDDLLGGVRHVAGGNDWQAGFLEDLLAQVLVGTAHAHYEGHAEVRLLGCGDHPVGDGVATHDAAEDIDQDALHLGVGQHELKSFSHFLGREI